MAPVQPGASVAATGLGIRYIGTDPQHCYAYSGLFPATVAPATVLDFTTGSGYIVGIMQLNAPADDDNPTAVRTGLANIKFNNVSVALLLSGTDANDVPARPQSVKQEFILPPFTRVVVEAESDTDSSDMFLSVVLIGQVYGAE